MPDTEAENSNYLLYSAEDSNPGFYDVYHRSDGKKMIVLDGLRIEDQPIDVPIQNFIHEHYDFFSLLYWLLLLCALSYLAIMNLVIPLKNIFFNRY